MMLKCSKVCRRTNRLGAGGPTRQASSVLVLGKRAPPGRDSSLISQIKLSLGRYQTRRVPWLPIHNLAMI